MSSVDAIMQSYKGKEHEILDMNHVGKQRGGKAMQWVREITGMTAKGFDMLKDGQVLCQLVNKIQPGTIKKKVNELSIPGGQMGEHP